MYIPEIEKAGREEIRRFQESQLPTLLNYLKENSPFYSQFFNVECISVWYCKEKIK